MNKGKVIIPKDKLNRARGRLLAQQMLGKSTVLMTTDDIMQLTQEQEYSQLIKETKYVGTDQ